MTEELLAIAMRYVDGIEDNLDTLMRELIEARRREVDELPPDLRDDPADRTSSLLDRIAALSPEELRRSIAKTEAILRERMAEQPGASFFDLDLSDRTTH